MFRRRSGGSMIMAGLFLSALSASALARSMSPSPSDEATSPAGRWFLTAANDRGLVGLADSTAHLTLAEDGTVTGHTGCNSLSGTYMLHGAAIDFARLVITKVACTDEAVMSTEAVLLEGLEAAATWDLTDGELGLRDADEELLLVFGEPSLEGAWTLAELAGAELVGLVEDTGVTAVFASDTLSGNTGCNAYSGPYSVEGPAIEIGPLTMTMRACVDETRNAIEAQVLGALDAAAAWTITDDAWLELADSDGGLLLGFRPDRTASP